MWKGKLRLKLCGRITLAVILLNFLMYPLFGEPLTEPQQSLSERGMRLYTDSEVDILIGEISDAAYVAIEQAAAETARAAFLISIEREAVALREAQRWRNEAELRLLAISEAKKTGRRNTILAASVGIAGGLVVGGIIGFGGR